MDINRVMLVRPKSACGWGFAWSPLAINLEYLGAAIEKDVDEIILVNHEYDSTDTSVFLKEFQPDLVGVSMCAVDHNSGLEICRKAKKHGSTTIIGSYHPTAMPNELMEYPQVDLIVRGEGELTLREFIRRGTPVGVKGMTYRRKGKVVHEPDRPLIKDLDTLPFPARHLRAGNECDMWRKGGGYHRDQIHFSRGCWGKCTFCNEPTMYHSIHRYRTPENCMEEIREVYKYHNEEPTLALFGDPHFMGRPKYVHRLAELLIEADLDMIFSTMIRSDMVNKHPETIKTMIEAGIIGSCMGIESPNTSDLAHTGKGMEREEHYKAARFLRKHHGVPGGTFVIGLPGQTEEEIRTFPEYARYIGLVNTGYAIATPLPATPFWQELEDQDLIDIKDFDLYDQMHSVWKQGNVSHQRLEELLTINLGRFYAPDIFMDDMINQQLRDFEGRKLSLSKTFAYLRRRWDFMESAGHEWGADKSREYGALLFQSMINPYTRKRFEKIGLHNVIELGPFLKVFGNQKIQASVSNGGKPLVHFVIKTTKDSIEYIDVTDRVHDDATLHLELDMAIYDEKKSTILWEIFSQLARKHQLRVVGKGILGALAYYLKINKNDPPMPKMSIPEEYEKTLCRLDGWDETGKKMEEIQARKRRVNARREAMERKLARKLKKKLETERKGRAKQRKAA